MHPTTYDKDGAMTVMIDAPSRKPDGQPKPKRISRRQALATALVVGGLLCSIWVGNNCGGLSWFDGQRFRTYNEKNGLSNSCVWALAEDGNSDLWIGTWGGGLFRFKQGRFTQYSIPQGLRSDTVRSIIAARDGSLWIATAGGRPA